jgi:16S rRNA U516 pseudouridylate synthase RsuA-like enzyme
MLDAVDSKVLKLVRTAIGGVRIGELQIGKWRELTAEEVAALKGSDKTGLDTRMNADQHR